MIIRHIEEAEGKLHLYGKSLQSAGERQVEVVQKGGRKGRVATCEVHFAPITLKMPSSQEFGDSACQARGFNVEIARHATPRDKAAG
ncbi:transposase Tn5 dimerization [Vibrio cholerae CT 5369-93]|nr:transposase Tn5 dimerization [Vibrio cholerae CT 5369-93]